MNKVLQNNKPFINYLNVNLDYLKKGIENSIDFFTKHKGFYWHIHEETIKNFYTSILKENDSAIDIGAHKGLHTFPLSEIIKTGKLLAIEPIPFLAKKLKDLFAAKANVTVENCALSDVVSKMDFYIYTEDLEESSLSKREERMKNRGEYIVEKIDVKTLDEYIDLFQSCKFIKIDAEGAKINILQGGKNFINKFRPLICLEFGDDVKYFNHTKGELFDWCEVNDYYLADIFGNIFKDKKIWEQPLPIWDFLLIPKK